MCCLHSHANTPLPALRHACPQFYDETRCLLPSLMQLLRSFMERSHQSLAAVGVAAFVRLCNKAGELKKGHTWGKQQPWLTHCCTLSLHFTSLQLRSHSEISLSELSLSEV